MITHDKVSAILLIGGKIPLFFREGKDKTQWWDLPGGKRNEIGGRLEDDDTALVREVKEELGVTAEITRFVADVPHVLHPNKFIGIYLCQKISGEPRNMLPDEHLDMQMFAPAEAVVKLGNRITPKVADFIRSLAPTPMGTGHGIPREPVEAGLKIRREPTIVNPGSFYPNLK